MVDRLNGIEHGRGLTVEGLLIPNSDIPVAPSRELMRDLLDLPRGSTVGIEFSQQFQEPFDVDDIEINAGLESNFYWRRIIRTCNIKKLNIVYLEDFDTYKKYVRKLLETKTLEQQGWDLYADNPEFFKTGQAKQLAAQHYMSETESQYIFVVEREAKILDKIRETNPTVVIIGKGHTDYLTQNTSDDNPLSNVEYTREVVFQTPWHWPEDLQLPYERAHKDYKGEIDPAILLERELLVRKYRAIKEKRITEGFKPDFVGTWDLDLPARGLFEVFVEGSRFGGRIEDTLGTAVFEGTINDTEVSFVKGYDPEKSSPEATPKPVRYAGNLVHGQYEGQYEVANTRISGSFTLKPI